jgi:hypothetical protein
MVSPSQSDENPLETGSVPHAQADHAGPEPGVSTPGSVVTGWTWGLVLAAGIAAGVGSWRAAEFVLDIYEPALRPAQKPMPTMDDAIQSWMAQVASGTAAFGAMGGIIGLAFGLAGGAVRRSGRAAGKAGAVGLLAGSAVAAGVAWAVLLVVYIYRRVDPQSHDLLIPLLYHEALWSLAGAVGGLAFGLGVGGRGLWVKTAFGGWIGAAFATAVYEMVGALAFPTHQAQYPLPGSPTTRALAPVLVALGAAIGMVLAAGEAKGKTVKG